MCTGWLALHGEHGFVLRFFRVPRGIRFRSVSTDPFDLWFKKRMADVTGVDLNNIPPGFAPPELLSHYDVTQMQHA